MTCIPSEPETNSVMSSDPGNGIKAERTVSIKLSMRKKSIGDITSGPEPSSDF